MRDKLYFGMSEDICSPLDSIIEDMHDEGIEELTVTRAHRENQSDFFYCNAHGIPGEKGWCGSGCAEYQPRNGKSGICKHNYPVYSHGLDYVLKLKEKGSYDHTLIEVGK